MTPRSIKAMTSLVKFVTSPLLVSGAARVTVKNLDLEPIKFKLVKESGWTVAQADRVAGLYKGFLLLHALYPDETHVPTQEIDEMWHAHILDTAKYMADCHRMFGYYLHHFPYLGLRGEGDREFAEDSFAATRERFLEMGIDPLAGDDIAASDCGGGGCSSSSCSSSSCSSGGNDSGDTGGGKGGDTTPDTPAEKGDRGGATIVPVPVPYPGQLPFNTPAACGSNDNGRRRESPATPAHRRPEPQRPLWRRILGLSGRATTAPRGWGASVSPVSRLAMAQRPGRDALLMLADTVPDGVTKH